MLTYRKNIWNKGIAVTPEKLNNIENGISNCINAINSLISKNGFSDSELKSLHSDIDKQIAAHNIDPEAHKIKFSLKADKNHRHNSTRISDIEDRLTLLEEQVGFIASKLEGNQEQEKDVEEEIENAE